jgi:hypothetical protein
VLVPIVLKGQKEIAGDVSPRNGFYFALKSRRDDTTPAGLPCLRHFIANLSIDPVTHVTGYYLSWLRHLGRVGLEAPTYARGLYRPPPSLNPPRRAVVFGVGVTESTSYYINADIE